MPITWLFYAVLLLQCARGAIALGSNELQRRERAKRHLLLASVFLIAYLCLSHHLEEILGSLRYWWGCGRAAIGLGFY